MRPPASLVLIGGFAGDRRRGARRAVAASAAAAEPRAVLDRYCVGCHNSAERAGGVALDGSTLDALRDNRDVWEHAVRKVRTGFMPPAGEPRPERTTLDRFASALEQRLDAAAGPRRIRASRRCRA